MQSAGILVFRKRSKTLEVFLVHPGGPFWAKKDIGAWSIPKGEFLVDELPLLAAQREFFEETGIKIEGDFMELAPVKLKSGKLIHAWAVETDFDASRIKSNEIQVQWPPKSGKFISIPEVDRGEWFDTETAKIRINPGQVPFISQLESYSRQ